MKKFLCTTVLAALLCLPLLAFASDPDEPEIQGAELTMGQVDPADETINATTPWGAPVLVSPNNGAALNHYPRRITLSWQPVTGATSYKVERGYYSITWHAYAPVTVTGFNNTSYTFDFVGDQRGRWRVTAYNGANPTTPSAWWTFSYVTKAKMSTPLLTNPAANEILYNYPRTVTLSWKMVPAAAGYKLEYSYCQTGNVDCVDYAPIIINDSLKSYHTLEFVGSQPGRWRVTTLGGTAFSDSLPTGWRWFTFDS